MVPPIQTQQSIDRVTANGVVIDPESLQAANESLNIISHLQITLDTKEMLAIFVDEIRRYVEVDAIRYSESNRDLLYQNGELSRHRCSYELKLLETELGSLTFTRGRRFKEAELVLLEYLLGTLLYPLRNALSYHDAMNAAHHDPLTQALNRSSLELNLPHEIQLAERNGDHLGLLVIDLDHFKRVNDNHGHLVGDHILRHVTRVMCDSLRGSDLLYRYGGEEFVILLRHTNIQDTASVAERIRSNLESAPYLHQDGDEAVQIEVTASIGHAGFQKGDSAESLFTRADRAVYRAKREGRNRCAD